MSKDPKKEDDEAFGLSVPTGNLSVPEGGDRPPVEQSQVVDQSDRHSGEKYKAMGWKGIDDDSEPEDEEEPAVSFVKKDPIPEDELDMTPMVDVTFLLLIFFMVTASFTLQKSMPQPPAASDEASTNVVEEDDAFDYVEVLIDQNNSFYVTTRDAEEIEAPSELEMRRMVKDAKDTYGPERIVVRAHVDAMYSRLITACDAGQSAGLEIEVKTTDIEF